MAAVKGTDLKNMLPQGGKKNCKECGLPTCFAFAMKLTKGGVQLDQCPYLTPETRAEIEAALAPAMALVKIGTGDAAFEIGREEVMYRHDKSFLRPPGIAVLISDQESDDEMDRKLDLMERAEYERAQVILRPDLWALRFDSGDEARFANVAKKVYGRSPLTALIISSKLDAMFAARDVYADRNPVIHPITPENVEQVLDRIKSTPTPLGVKSPSMEGLIALTERLSGEGIDQLLLDSCPSSLSGAIEDQTLIRRAALKHGVKALGYPTVVFPADLADNALDEALFAGAMVAKYAGIVVVSDPTPDYLYPLLVHRMDIYSDPRKLRTVEAKVYEINDPGPNAPVLVSTNFALTYFNVSYETESSRVPAFLAILDTGGLGVEAGMGAGKFTAVRIARYIKDAGLESTLKTRRLILPFVASRIKNELPEELPGWEIMVGPKAINHLPAFLVEKGRQWGIIS